ncbi:restriction endonuclease subunit S [Streptomyces sp. NPDC046374]|uniref:restriction endonuclease subunit S n=1 Tax=Streptomyces sp. NPDC046374 TaxID=3154917 RepID=UPI0033D37582
MSNTELPPGWALASLADLVSPDGIFSDGDWVESKDQDPDGEVRLVQLADVGDGRFRDRSNRSLTLAKASDLRCTFIQEGDVLVARMPDPLGRSCIFPGGNRPAVTVVDVCVIRPGRHGVDNRWLMWAINSPQVRSQIQTFQTGTTRKRISRKNLEKAQLAVPPLAEQRRIVESVEGHLSRLDAAEELVVKSYGRLQNLRASLLQKVLDSCSVYPKDSLGNLIREPLRNGHSARASESNDGIRTINLTAVTTGEFSDRNSKVTVADARRVKDLWLTPGDILIQRSNTPDLVGTAALYSGPKDWAIYPDLLIRVRVNERILPEFAAMVLSTPRLRKYFRGRAKGLSGSMPKVDQAAIMNAEFPVPPIEIQREAVMRASALSGQVDLLAAEVSRVTKRARQLRRAVLRAAHDGHLVPQESDEESAVELLEKIRTERSLLAKGSRAGTRRSKGTAILQVSSLPAPLHADESSLPRTAVQQEFEL